MHDEISRRIFLARAGRYSALTYASLSGVLGQLAPSNNPFTLGVASGDPLPDGVVLWTRLAPDPLNGGGMPSQNVEVEWQVAEDEGMRRIVKQGREIASPALGHSVHADVRGLKPARWYWYRFKTGAQTSIIGRTRTAPDARARLDKLSFAFASCQNYQDGYYTSHGHMAEEELDLVIHLGDYIYEGGPTEDRPRRHNSPEILSLNDYRNRYALYKLDPELQKVHARFPWIVTWDDHEVANNYAGDISAQGLARDKFLERRANAYQAYYENMPLRRTSLPKGSSLQLYRRLGFGDLAEFSVLDTRQYRTDQPCGDGAKPVCAEVTSPSAQMIGVEQERWLFQGLADSKRQWNVIAQQVMMAQVDLTLGKEQSFGMDLWSGYALPRKRVLDFLDQRNVSNAVVITGDIHSNWVADLKVDFDEPKSRTVGTEFVGTSISSGGDGSDQTLTAVGVMLENPHIKFQNSRRGYVKCTVTPKLWQSDFRTVPFVSKPGAEISTRASFIVEAGHPGAQPS
jgi:alkaline phosphatase D